MILEKRTAMYNDGGNYNTEQHKTESGMTASNLNKE